jgi:hypothetical protein
MRLARRIFLIITLLLVAATVWAGVYAQRRGFSSTWRELVESEFALRGYYVDIGRLTLGPFQGLVAEDVRFFNDPQRRRELAFVDNVILDLDLTDVLNRDLAINTLDVKDATLTLPVKPGQRDSEMLKVDHFSARLVVTESQIEIVRAQATVAGIEVSLKGSLYRPPRNVTPAQGEATEAELEAQRTQLIQIRRRLDRVQTVLTAIERFAFAPGNPPKLEINFAGDLADLAHLNAEGRLAATDFQRGAYLVRELTMNMEFDGARQRVLLKDLHLVDNAGDLRLRGEWTMERREIDFDLESNADLPALAASVWATPKWGEVVFFSPPRVEAEGTANVDAVRRFLTKSTPGSPLLYLPLEMTGEIRCDRFGSRGAVFDGMEAQFAIQGGRQYVRNLRLDHKSGVMFANFMHDPGRVADRLRFQTEIKLDPRIFAPFLARETTRKFLSNWQFGAESTVYLAGLGSGPSLDPATWTSAGVIDLRRFRLNQVPFDHLESEYEARDKIHDFRNLAVERPEGALTATALRHLPEREVWEASEVRSNLDLADLVRAVAPGWSETLKRYRFSQPPEISLNGRIDASKSGSEHDFEMKFASAQPATFDFLGRPLPLGSPTGTITAKSARWRILTFGAEVFGGKLSATFDGESLQSQAAYTASIGVSGVSFDNLLHLYGDTERQGGGTWTGDLRFSGKLGDPRSVLGEGRAELREGNLMAIPLFAPAYDTLAKVLGGDSPRTADPLSPKTGMGGSASLKLMGGVLSATDLRVSTEGFDLSGEITVDRLSRTFASELDTGLASGIGPRLTLAGEGSPEAPQWRVKLPRVP